MLGDVGTGMGFVIDGIIQKECDEAVWAKLELCRSAWDSVHSALMTSWLGGGRDMLRPRLQRAISWFLGSDTGSERRSLQTDNKVCLTGIKIPSD